MFQLKRHVVVPSVTVPGVNVLSRVDCRTPSPGVSPHESSNLPKESYPGDETEQDIAGVAVSPG
jgi:hypothetical protein